MLVSASLGEVVVHSGGGVLGGVAEQLVEVLSAEVVREVGIPAKVVIRHLGQLTVGINLRFCCFCSSSEPLRTLLHGSLQQLWIQLHRQASPLADNGQSGKSMEPGCWIADLVRYRS